MSDEKQIKIVFELEQDENGFPPDKWETLWAVEDGTGLYVIDNIPFFVKGVSSGDLVSAKKDGDELIFVKVVKPSTNSVFRVYVRDVETVPQVREQFRSLGCESEVAHIPKLVAIELPGDRSFNPVANLLAEGEENGRWGYDEGVLRHDYSSSE